MREAKPNTLSVHAFQDQLIEILENETCIEIGFGKLISEDIVNLSAALQQKSSVTVIPPKISLLESTKSVEQLEQQMPTTTKEQNIKAVEQLLDKQNLSLNPVILAVLEKPEAQPDLNSSAISKRLGRE